MRPPYLKNILRFLLLTAFFCALNGTSVSWAAAPNLDENDEIQWVMGDLSALKTAAQIYFSDSNENRTCPPLSSLLAYFDPESLPPDAATLYAVTCNRTGWFVGYLSDGLQDETYRLLEENAVVLGLLADDLSSPWRRGSRRFWTRALSLSENSRTSTSNVTNITNNHNTTVIRNNDRGSDLGTAAAIIGTAALINIITDNNDTRYFFHVPGSPWFWRSSIVYRPVYYNRFVFNFYRPMPPRARPLPSPRYRHRGPRVGQVSPSFRNSVQEVRRNPNPNRDLGRLDRRSVEQRFQDRNQPPRLRNDSQRPGGQRPPQGQRPQTPQRPGGQRPPQQGQRPQTPQRPGGQRPPQGQRPQTPQRPQTGRPSQGQRPQTPQRPGGQRPSQGQRPQTPQNRRQ